MHSRFYRTAQFVFSFFKFSNKWFDEIQKINDGNRLKQFTFSFMKENFNQNYIIYHQETEIWYGNLCNNRKIVAEPLLYARGRIALWVVTVLARPFKNLIRSCGTLSGRNYNDQIKSWSELLKDWPLFGLSQSILGFWNPSAMVVIPFISTEYLRNLFLHLTQWSEHIVSLSNSVCLHTHCTVNTGRSKAKSKQVQL